MADDSRRLPFAWVLLRNGIRGLPDAVLLLVSLQQGWPRMTQSATPFEAGGYTIATRWPEREARAIVAVADCALGKHDRPRATNQPEWVDAADFRLLVNNAPDQASGLGFLIQWRCGLRAHEMLDLIFDDVDGGSAMTTGRDVRVVPGGIHGLMRVRHGKGNRARIVSVHPEVAAAIRTAKSWRRAVKGDPVVKLSMRTYQRRFSAASLAAELPPGLSTHALRHGFAMHCVLNGIPLPILQAAMGHAHISTTFRYFRMMPDVNGMIARLP